MNPPLTGEFFTKGAAPCGDKMWYMNNTELNGNWNEVKGKLKQKFANLTDNDMLFADGKRDEMIGRLQVKLGKSKDEMTKLLASL